MVTFLKKVDLKKLNSVLGLGPLLVKEKSGPDNVSLLCAMGQDLNFAGHPYSLLEHLSKSN